jgi:hypothetical protein
MNTLIDTLINLDTDDYLLLHKDVQLATNGMSEIDQKLWILTHFIKNGYGEKRKYHLKTRPKKTRSSSDTETKTKPKPAPSEKPKERHRHSRSGDDDDDETDVQKLIQKFREKHSKNNGGVRDKVAEVEKPNLKH